MTYNKINAYRRNKAPLLEIPIYKADNEKPLVLLTNLIIYRGKRGLETISYENIVDALILNLYFPDHTKERGIDVLEFVEQDINEVMQGRDFDQLNDSEKEQVIEVLTQKWSDPQHEVARRMALFKERSRKFLKPILER